jgi:hypothetical protein
MLQRSLSFTYGGAKYAQKVNPWEYLSLLFADQYDKHCLCYRALLIRYL